MTSKLTVKIVGGLLIVAILAGSYVLYDRNERNHRAIYLNGNVDIRNAELAFRVSGKLIEMKYEEGAFVQAGEVLAKIDPVPYEVELKQREADKIAAFAVFSKFTAGNRPQEIQEAQALLKEREVTHENALATLARQKELSAKKFASQQTLDDASAREKELQAQLRSAKAGLNLIEAGFRVEEINQSKAQYEAALAQFELAKIHLDDTVLKAPNKGILLTRIQEPGSILSVGEPVYTLSLTSPIWIRAYISETDLGRVKPGMKALITIDARPNQPFHGTVGFISPQAEFTPKNIETKDLRTDLVYRIRIWVEDPNGVLRQGMPVSIELPLQHETKS